MLYKWELRLMSLYRNNIARWRKTNDPLSANALHAKLLYNLLDFVKFISKTTPWVRVRHTQMKIVMHGSSIGNGRDQFSTMNEALKTRFR